MDKYDEENKYLNFIKSHPLPERFVLILYLVDKTSEQYYHYPMNYLRNLGISNVMTTHYIVMDMDLHISCKDNDESM